MLFRSKGLLTVVKNVPVTGEIAAIPFYISLRRDGKVVENKKMPFAHKQLDKINIEEVFKFAKEGDLLIIKPARAEDWRAKRILKLIVNGC